MTSDAFWDTFEKSIRDQFPEKLALLPAGASAEAIHRAEQKIKAELPGVVKRFYQRHDGSGDFYFSPWGIAESALWILPLKQIALGWKELCEIGQQFERDGEFGKQQGPIKRNYWNQKWIPIADDGGGDMIFIDLDPREEGSPGQMVDWWHEGAESTLVANGFTEWLQAITGAIEQGKVQVRTGRR